MAGHQENKSEKTTSNTYSSNKALILTRSFILIIICPILIWLSLNTNKHLSALLVLTAIITAFWQGSFLKSLASLFDFIVVQPDGIVFHKGKHEEHIKWNQVHKLRIDASYWDGVIYVLELNDGTVLKFSDKIKHHLALYNQISTKVSRNC